MKQSKCTILDIDFCMTKQEFKCDECITMCMNRTKEKWDMMEAHKEESPYMCDFCPVVAVCDDLWDIEALRVYRNQSKEEQ